jgi:cell division protein FtsB
MTAQPGARRRIGIAPQAIALVLVLGLAGAMAIQPTRQLLDQRDRIARMSEDLSAMRQANRALEDRIARLNDPDYLEQQARAQIGLVRPGETTFLVMPPAGKKGRRDHKRGEARRPTNERSEGFVERVLDLIGI